MISAVITVVLPIAENDEVFTGVTLTRTLWRSGFRVVIDFNKGLIDAGTV